jgi:hypothetical protein
MIIIQHTEESSYIRISYKNDLHHNIGYISPNDGELSVKSELMELIKMASLNNMFVWVDGCGHNGGSGYDSHTTNHSSVSCTLEFIKRVFVINSIEVEVRI